MEIISFETIQDLEFKLFKDLGDVPLREFDLEDITSDLKRNIFEESYRLRFGKVIFLFEDKVICNTDGSYFYCFQNDFNLKIGDLLLFDDNNDKQFIKINEDVLTEKFVLGILDLRNKKDWREISIKEFSEKEIITKENILETLKRKSDEWKRGENARERQRKKDEEKRLKEEITKKARREKEEERELAKDKDKIEAYEQSGIAVFNCGWKTLKIDGNEIDFGGSYEKERFELNRNINSFLTYKELKSFSNQSGNDDVEDFLIRKRENYTKKNNKGVKEYEVSFEEGIVKVNGTKVSNSKLKFVLGKVGGVALSEHRELTEKEIKLLCNLSGMAFDFCNLKEIDLTRDYKIPIFVSAINKDKFKIDFLGKTKEFNWVEVKKWFFYNGGSRTLHNYWDNEKIIDFTKELGVGKQELLTYLKRTKILGELDS